MVSKISSMAHDSRHLIFFASIAAQQQQINNGIPIASDSAIPPSVNKGNKSPPLPSPGRESHREAGDGEFALFFHFLPSIPNVFSWAIFSIKFLFLLPALMALPQSRRGIKARPRHPLLANPREKWATVSLYGDSIFFPLIPNVFSRLIFRLNCYFVVGVDGPPSNYKGNKNPLLPPLTCESQREVGDGEFV